MAAFSNKLENLLVDHIFRATSFTMPSNIYIALLTTNCVASDTGTTLTSGTGGTGVEVTGGSYARQAYNPSSSSNWTATQGGVSGASSGTSGNTQNNTAITFPTATAGWGTVVAVAILDAVTNGNLLFFGSLTASKTINSGDVFQFAANALVVNLN